MKSAAAPLAVSPPNVATVSSRDVVHNEDNEALDADTATIEPISIPLGAMPLLRVTDPTDEVRTFPLFDGERLIVGAASNADVRLEDRTASARHCELVLKDGVVRLGDLDSKNGTYVGATRVRDAICHPGSIITVGGSTLELLGDLPQRDRDVLEEPPLRGVIGHSVAMRGVARAVRRYAKLSAPVLILGETGCGKELIASALHAEGPRAREAFIPLNVASLPRELVESELFGHERGAFTGATRNHEGAFALAAKGTLFLDEIGELPTEAQPKLLRALDGYEVRRVGATRGQTSTARIVAATHVTLERGVELGTFRRDLYHRLEVFVVRIPPLRERPGDIALIAREVLRRSQLELGARSLAPAAIALLSAHTWPGNVRELRNVLLRAASATDDAVIEASHLQSAMQRAAAPRAALSPASCKAALRKAGANVSAAARAMGVPRSTFRKLLNSA
jgi:transcriptional regulator of acetoin/glycerol metabolism